MLQPYLVSLKQLLYTHIVQLRYTHIVLPQSRRRSSMGLRLSAEMNLHVSRHMLSDSSERGGYPCAMIPNVGFGALLPDDSALLPDDSGIYPSPVLPPTSEPYRQCVFQLCYVIPGVTSHRLDDRVVCVRWQLTPIIEVHLASSPYHFFPFYLTGLGIRKCACCQYIQFKHNHATLGLKARLQTCEGCFAVRYCNAACQLEDWPNHRADCRALHNIALTADLVRRRLYTLNTQAPTPTQAQILQGIFLRRNRQPHYPNPNLAGIMQIADFAGD